MHSLKKQLSGHRNTPSVDSSSIPYELIDQLINSLAGKGLKYADVRYEYLLHESLSAEGGHVSSISLDETTGIGIRVLINNAWGFASTPHLDPAHISSTVTQAIELAKAASLLNRIPLNLAPTSVVKAKHQSQCLIDPFEVPLSQKLDDLLAANKACLGPNAIKRAQTYMDFYKRVKFFRSTEGAHIEQLFHESAAGLEIIAQENNEVQSRSFPNSHQGTFSQAGYEHITGLDLVKGAKHAQREVLQLLKAKTPKIGETTIILDPTQVVMQLHESCGHPVELDRALGHELSYAGGSFMTPEKLGNLRYGSSEVTIVADATIPGGVGSFGFDDEGVPAQCVEIIRDGLFVNYLSSRETSARIGLSASSAAMRAENWSVPPIIRMTNVNLQPKDATLNQLMHGIKHGYLLSTNKSWSIDDQRLNFQFSTEIGWEINNGKLGAMVHNPLYTGITPEFWGKCTGVGRKEDWQLWGVPNCAKGEPIQVMPVGHGASYARFDGVSLAVAK